MQQLHRKDEEEGLKVHRRPKGRGTTTANGTAEIVYDDESHGKGGKKKKGTTLHWAELAGENASLAEQRRRAAAEDLNLGGSSTAPGEEVAEGSNVASQEGGGVLSRANARDSDYPTLANETMTKKGGAGTAGGGGFNSVMDFPELGAGSSSKGPGGAGGNQSVVNPADKLADAMLSVLRSYHAEHDEHSKCLLVENINFKLIRAQEPIPAAPFLRRVFEEAAGGKIKAMELFENCGAAVVEYNELSDAISGIMVLVTRTIHNKKFMVSLVNGMPTKGEVIQKANMILGLEPAKQAEVQHPSRSTAAHQSRQSQALRSGSSVSRSSAAAEGPSRAPASAPRAIYTGKESSGGETYLSTTEVTGSLESGGGSGSTGPGSLNATSPGARLRISATPFVPTTTTSSGAAIETQETSNETTGGSNLGTSRNVRSASSLSSSSRRSVMQTTSQPFVPPDVAAAMSLAAGYGMPGYASMPSMMPMPGMNMNMAMANMQMGAPMQMPYGSSVVNPQVQWSAPGAMQVPIPGFIPEYGYDRYNMSSMQAPSYQQSGPNQLSRSQRQQQPQQQERQTQPQQQQQQQTSQMQRPSDSELARQRRLEQEKADEEMARSLQAMILNEDQERRNREFQDAAMAASIAGQPQTGTRNNSNNRNSNTPGEHNAPTSGNNNSFANVTRQAPGAPPQATMPAAPTRPFSQQPPTQQRQAQETEEREPQAQRQQQLLSMLLPGYHPQLNNDSGTNTAAPAVPAAFSSGETPAASSVLPYPSPPVPVASSSRAPGIRHGAGASAPMPQRPAYRPLGVGGVGGGAPPPQAYRPLGVSPGGGVAVHSNSQVAPSQQPAPAAAAATSSPAAPSPAAPAGPLKKPCPKCHAREAKHIWLPCGHYGHCMECIGNVPQEETTKAYPNCIVCQKPAVRYMRIFA